MSNNCYHSSAVRLSLCRIGVYDAVVYCGASVMAKCDEGYLCSVCGAEVEGLLNSDLYLRYVIGEVDPETLHTMPERHLRCNPTLAQFIVDDEFEPVTVDGPFDKRNLDPSFVRERQVLVNRGWRRLKEVQGLDLPVMDYPLPEVRQKWS